MIIFMFKAYNASQMEDWTSYGPDIPTCFAYGRHRDGKEVRVPELIRHKFCGLGKIM